MLQTIHRISSPQIVDIPKHSYLSLQHYEARYDATVTYLSDLLAISRSNCSIVLSPILGESICHCG